MSAIAQCDPQVVPGTGVAGATGAVRAFVEWDPDGPGPLGPHVVVAGSFGALVGTAAHGLGLFDPATGSWSRLGDADRSVFALAVAPNGDLIVGGDFEHIGGIAANRVARFDGAVWSPLGTGITPQPNTAATNTYVAAVAVRPNGDVFATGRFTIAGGTAAWGLARWNGTAWSAVGDLSVANVATFGQALHVMPNGDLVCSGIFAVIGGVVATCIAAFDGTTWRPLGSGLHSAAGGLASATAFAVNPAGELVAIGGFATAGGVPVNGVATWDGANWHGVGAPWSAGYPTTGIALANGDLLVGSATGLFLAPGLAPPVMRLRAGAWQPVGFDGFDVRCLFELPNGTLLAGGAFPVVGTQPARHLATWSGTQWQPLTAGSDGPANVVLQLRDGRLFAGGEFTQLDGAPARNAAFRDAGGWHDAGLPFGAPIIAAVERPDGSIALTARASQYSSAILILHDGLLQSMTSILGSETVRAMLSSGEGDVIVGGDLTLGGSHLAVWDGSVWNPLIAGLDGEITALCFLPDGSIAVGGTLSFPAGTPLGHLAIWNGQQWNTLGGGTSAPPTALTVAIDGSLIAVGPFQTAGTSTVNGVARWDGQSWHALGSGFAAATSTDALYCVATLPSGDLLVGGAFANAGGVPARNVARWDGTAWHPLGTGTSNGADDPVRSIAVAADGRIALGGSFVRVEATTTAFVARYAAPCPAISSPYGGSCYQGQWLQLDSARGAFLGGALETVATGLPNFGLALAAYGVAPAAQPLSTLVPQAVPGCRLTVLPVFANLVVPAFNAATATLPIPRAAPLLGQWLYHQVLSLELSPSGAIASVGGTNGLAVTIGALW